MFPSPVPFAITEKQLCFIHIPKTAGSTLTYLMRRVYGHHDVYPHNFMEPMVTLTQEQRDSFHYIGAHMRPNVRDYLSNDPAFITFLRDPVQRVISHYRHAKLLESSPYGPVVKQDMTLEAFLHDEAHRFRVDNHQTVYLGVDLLLENQPSDYNPFPIVTDAIFEKAKQNLDRFLLVGLQDRFEESLNLLCRLLGWPSYRQNNKINVTPGRIEDELIPTELIEEIRQRNTYDMALYEHGKALFVKQLDNITGGKSIFEEADRFYHSTFKTQYPATDHFTYDFRYTPIGSNWYAPTRGPNDIFVRHMGPETSSFVDLPITSDHNLILTFDIPVALSMNVVDSLTVTVNDQTITLARTPLAQGFQFVGEINKHILAEADGRVRVKFTVDRTLSPKELGINENTHALGPAFSQLQVRPLP